MPSLPLIREHLLKHGPVGWTQVPALNFVETASTAYETPLGPIVIHYDAVQKIYSAHVSGPFVGHIVPPSAVNPDPLTTIAQWAAHHDPLSDLAYATGPLSAQRLQQLEYACMRWLRAQGASGRWWFDVGDQGFSQGNLEIPLSAPQSAVLEDCVRRTIQPIPPDEFEFCLINSRFFLVEMPNSAHDMLQHPGHEDNPFLEVFS